MCRRNKQGKYVSGRAIRTRHLHAGAADNRGSVTSVAGIEQAGID
jgi:hypothetical protein